MQFVPYVFFDGNCREAFEFYANHLGGKIEAMLTHEGRRPGARSRRTSAARLCTA